MIHLILGHGGYVTSFGFAQFGNSLRKGGYQVITWPTAQDIHRIARGVRENERNGFPTVLLGYSLGGNACAWVAQLLGTISVVPIDLVVAFDPTRNGPSLANYPLGPHVKRAISIKGMSYGPTSLFFGGGQLVGPQVEIVQTWTDHIAVQFDNELREVCREAIAVAYYRKRK